MQMSSIKGIVVLSISSVAAVVLLVVIGNYILNPLIYSKSQFQYVAEQLQAGKNYTLYDPNINWRALRREQIKLLTTKPQVVVSGGSRWQEANSSHVADKTFFNAHGHSDYIEDFFAIVYLLEQSNKLPETLILSLRYRIFEPVALRKHTGWREWVPEYRQMARKVGARPHSFFSTMKTEHYTALLSLSGLWNQSINQLAANERPQATSSSVSDTLDTLISDGSLRWSMKNQIRFSPEFALKDAQTRLNRFIDFNLEIDVKLINATEALFSYLQSKNINVVLAQTPFHPVFYKGVQNTNFGATLKQIDKLGKQFAKKYGFQNVGSFNPEELGCSANQFIDWHHGTPECLENVFKQIKFP